MFANDARGPARLRSGDPRRCVLPGLNYAGSVSWGRLLLIVVGVIALLSRATILATLERNRRKLGEQWTSENRLLAVILTAPPLAFGAICVTVGVWPGTRDLLYLAGAIIVVGYLAEDWASVPGCTQSARVG